jgi:hypothetical protein
MESSVNGMSFMLKYANKSSFSVPGSPTHKKPGNLMTGISAADQSAHSNQSDEKDLGQ